MNERSVEHGTSSSSAVRGPPGARSPPGPTGGQGALVRRLRRALELDFRAGGRESRGGTAPDGRAYTYEALYDGIVQAQRIVYTYEMSLEGIRNLRLPGDGGVQAERSTRLVFTEQGAFFEGHESRPGGGGMGTLLDALGRVLQGDTR